MVIFVLDASAVIRFLDGEPGVHEVTEMFLNAVRGQCRLLISAVNWGEIAGKLHKKHGKDKAQEYLHRLLAKGLEVVPATAQRAESAAIIASDHRIPYADSFGVELASDSTDHVLVTADFDVKPVEVQIKIVFLPVKPKP